MVHNFNFTECNSAVSIFEHQAHIKERLDSLLYMAYGEPELVIKKDDSEPINVNVRDRTKLKVIDGRNLSEFNSKLHYSKWSEEQLQCISKYLTDKEMALFVYSSFVSVTSDFVLKYESIYHSLFDKITKYLGVVVLFYVSHNGIDCRFGTLNLYKGLRTIDDVKPHDVNENFVDIMVYKSKSGVPRTIQERWEQVQIAVENGDTKKAKMLDLITNNFGEHPLRINAADILIAMRNKLGLTQREFAERYNIPVSTYVHWEQATRKPLDYVMFMLYRLVADDLLFAYEYDIRSVYAVISSYSAQYDIDSIYVCIETNDGVLLKNTVDNDLFGSMFNKHIFFANDIVTNYMNEIVLESSVMTIDNKTLLKLKLDISSDNIKAFVPPMPIVHAKDKLDLNATGKYEENLHMGRIIKNVANWLIHAMLQVMNYYYFEERQNDAFDFVGDMPNKEMFDSEEEFLNDYVADISAAAGEVCEMITYVTPVLSELILTCYNQRSEYGLSDIIPFLFGDDSQEAYVYYAFIKNMNEINVDMIANKCEDDEQLASILLTYQKRLAAKASKNE